MNENEEPDPRGRVETEEATERLALLERVVLDLSPWEVHESPKEKPPPRATTRASGEGARTRHR